MLLSLSLSQDLVRLASCLLIHSPALACLTCVLPLPPQLVGKYHPLVVCFLRFRTGNVVTIDRAIKGVWYAYEVAIMN